MNVLCKLLIWSFLCCLRTTRDQRKKRYGEAAYEILIGEWQDTAPPIFLRVVL